MLGLLRGTVAATGWSAARDKYPERFGAFPRMVGVLATGCAPCALVDELVLFRGVPADSDAWVCRLGCSITTRPATRSMPSASSLVTPGGLNLGFTGPQVPSKYQDPLPVDDVAAGSSPS